jgi:hypothetical protein
MVIAGCSANNGSTGSVGQNLTPTAAPPASDGTEVAYQPAPAADEVTGKNKVSLRRNFYFVFDGSGSMKEPPRTQNSDDDHAPASKIEGAKWAVHEFLQKVPDDVNLGLYVFDRYGNREVLPLGPNNRDKFLQDIDKISASGGTPLGAAIAKGTAALAKQYDKQLGYGEYRLIVITDGEATDSLSIGVSAAEVKRIPIYTIGFDIGQEHSLRRHSISYRSASSAKEVEQGLEEAAAELDVFDQSSFHGGGKRKPARQG